MKNAKKIDFNDIMNREILIGGLNLLEDKNRAQFIKKFYNYALQDHDDFNTTWSQWLKNNEGN